LLGGNHGLRGKKARRYRPANNASCHSRRDGTGSKAIDIFRKTVSAKAGRNATKGKQAGGHCRADLY